MDCPACGHAETGVKDSRSHGQFVRRIRECTNCGHNFRTTELAGVFETPPTLSPDDKHLIRRAFAKILAVLGISLNK